jgi:predicted ATPase/DNA-binding NarL/FixJ family response regulator
MRQNDTPRRPIQKGSARQGSARNRALQTLGPPRRSKRRPTDRARRARAGVNRPPHHLPAQRTRLIGREQDHAELRQRLLRPDVRLMTLAGPPGVGKTRLALAVAEAVVADFQHGVVFVPLAPLGDPALVVSAIAHQVGAQEQGSRSLLESLTALLERQHRLLVLDNFEHVLDAAPVITNLLVACPHLKVLATSRTRLHLYGEHEMPVAPLGLPDAVDVPNVARLREAPAVALFVERAEAVRPRFALTEENAAAVAEICARLDGLPLAIELAAARVRLLAPGAILERLDQRLDLLAEGPRDWPARHRTARALVDWSYDLLSEEQRVLLRRLSVFAGGWTLEAAEAVCGFGVLGPASTLELLSGLVDQSLLMAEEQGGAGRFRLLETIRQHGAAKLQEAREEAVVRDRHRAWCLALAEQAEPALWGPEQGAWLERLDAEVDNVRAALAWSVEQGAAAGPAPSDTAAEAGLRLATALWRYWDVRGHLREGRGWLERLLAVSPPRTAARAKALFAAGDFATRQADPAGVALYEESIALARELQDEQALALSLTGLGMALHLRGDDAAAQAAVAESLALARKMGHELVQCFALFWAGNVALAQGEHERATTMLEECIALGRRRDDRWSLAYPLISLAFLASLQGDYERAAALLREGLLLRQEQNDKQGSALCVEGLGCVASMLGHAERAARLFGVVDALRESIGAGPLFHWAIMRDEAVAAARTRLGEDAYAAACTEGRALPLDEAIAYALEPERVQPRAGTSALASATPPKGQTAGGAQVSSLTRREREVAALVARGLTYRQIAEELVIAERTADTHVANILRKLGLANRSQLAAWAIHKGLLPHEPD